MKRIAEFRFENVSVDFSGDEKVIVQDDDVKIDVETEVFKQICIQYLCLECPDVIKFDGDNEEIPTETPEEKEALDEKTYRYEKVTDSIFDLKEEFERGELFSFDGDEHYVYIETEGDFSYAHVHENLYRRIEVTERELELEAAYDLYCTAMTVNNEEPKSFEHFSKFKYKLAWITIVRKTGYRKSLNDVNGKG